MVIATLIGHLGNERQCLNGQTIKTRTIKEALDHHFGRENIHSIDTYGGLLFLLKLPFILLVALYHSTNIIILPAQRGIKIISPILVFYNIFFKRKVHYVVIGGWLPKMLENSCFLKYLVQRFDAIYVETKNMQTALQSLAINNVIVMPNFKNIPLRTKQDIDIQEFQEPYPLCTFSRVSKEKGIEYAINAVKEANERLGKIAFRLDIYGQIEKEKEWFTPLMIKQPDYIKYCGAVGPNDSVNILSRYFMLLFPTYYEGEGFAGTLIDAMFTGLPVIATDWHNNSEIIEHNKNGYLVPIKDNTSISNILVDIACDPKKLQEIRINCNHTAKNYCPSNVIQILINQLI